MRSLLRLICRHIWLGLLTLFLITAVLPLAAEHPPIMALVQNLINAPTQLEQGITLYNAGRFTEAAAIWKQAAQNYQYRGDRLNQGRSLSYLTLAYQDLGQWQEAQKAIATSLELLTNNQQPLPSRREADTTNNQLILAQALNTKASLQLAMGQAAAALNTWKEAESIYANVGDEVGKLGSQINQAQALQTLGLYRRAQKTLEQVNQQLQAQPDSLLKATGLRGLGITLQVVGDLLQSQKVLEQSLAITQRLDVTPDISANIFSLANIARDLQDYEKALSLYQQTTEKANNPLTKLESQLNQLSLLVKTKQWQSAQALLPQIQLQLTNLPPSRSAVYAQVNLAESLIKMSLVMSDTSLVDGEAESKTNINQPVVSPKKGTVTQDVAQLLAKAVEQARLLKDQRAEAYALGQLGQLYEQTQQWEDAQKLTQQALTLAQGINAAEIAARWQWQLGRILKQQGQPTAAVAAYTEAVNTLQFLRGDLVAINPDIQFSFRESVEPVYRELVQLLLSSPTNQKKEISQQNLKQARQVIESLQLAELDNFFRQACLQSKSQQIDQIDATAAVIYPIILPDRLAVILSLPGQPLRHYETLLPQSKVENILEELLSSLNPAFAPPERLRLSQQVYDWLIRPAETQLAQSQVKTLVFVLDGALQNLPMAALYDGKQYLVEKYSIALSQGLQLLESRSLNQERLTALTVGLTEARQGFSALPGVALEVKQIASEIPSKVLLNQEFTRTTLESQIKAEPFPLVHLATHGQFSSKAEETFLLTWDGKINVKDLDQLLRARERQDKNPIELLVLSACQSAAGDKRATLGLAGFALRSGARSTLATLWSVRDQSTAKLMTEFYNRLTQPNMTKAEALRQAQLALLKQRKYDQPFYWAPFVLVGNWL